MNNKKNPESKKAKIDVIIPAYNAHETIKRTLFSIAYQENIKDIKVYIVNDASKTDYSKEIKQFKNFMDITELTLKENGGPGIARQYGIDNSNSEYIIFIDSDDVFNNPYSITTLYNNINNSNYDVVISSFYEMLYDGSILEHTNDTIWMHGKIYRRKFLKDKNIKFNNTRANEDNGFNQLIFLYDSKIKTIEDYTYIWMYNEKSITRINDQEYLFSGLEGYIQNITWALNIAIKNNCNTKKISNLAFSAIVAIYYYYIEFINEPHVDNLIKKSKQLYEICLKYPIKTKKEKTNLWYKQYLESAKDMKIENKLNPPITLEEFLSNIERT